MNGDTRIERQLPQILTDLGAGPTPDYTDTILARTAATRQRPGLVFPERWVPMSALTQRMAAAPRISWRTVAVLALLILALVSAALYAGSQQRRLPAPFGPADNGLIPFVANGDLFLGDPLTGESRLLISSPEADALPQFSPDGTRLAYIRDVGTTAIKPIDIYVAPQDGSSETKITPEPIWNWLYIAWTPDGQGVAVVSKDSASTHRLDVYDAAGSGSFETILEAPQLDFVEFRPPDGSEILFRARLDGSYGLFGMDADGSNVHPILLSSDPENQDFWGGAAYTPDGSRIFYTRPYVRETADGSTCCSLWVMNADGSDPHQFIPIEGKAWDGQPAVSPDGSMVAFWHVKDSAQVAVAPADGSGSFITTGPEMTDRTVRWVWAPDSSKLLMIPNDGSSRNAYLLDPAGGPWSTVPWESDTDIDWQRIAAD
jgi:Tol biopolymer transport system component